MTVKIADLMAKRVIAARPHHSVAHARAMMEKNAIHSVPVVGPDNEAKGVIGYCKNDGHLGRNLLKGRLGDRINTIMSAVGYNLRLTLRWIRKLPRKIISAIDRQSMLNDAC